MARRRGAVAPASARGCKIQLSRLKHVVLHNLPHSSKHVDVLKLMLGIDRCWMGSCRVDFRPGLCRSSAPARRRASRAWQDGLAAWASHWAGCQGAMVGRRALVVVWARSRRGHDAWAVAWVGRRRAWPSCVTGRRVALSDGPYQRTTTSSMRKEGLHHKCMFMAQSATCASVQRLSWHTHN